jgi:hypothetical protein
VPLDIGCLGCACVSTAVVHVLLLNYSRILMVILDEGEG